MKKHKSWIKRNWQFMPLVGMAAIALIAVTVSFQVVGGYGVWVVALVAIGVAFLLGTIFIHVFGCLVALYDFLKERKKSGGGERHGG